jgi:hypothetical protein
MIEYLIDIPYKYSKAYKRSESDFRNGSTINQLITRANNRIKALNKQTKIEIDRINRKYDNAEEEYILNKMKKKDKLLNQELFKLHFKKA